MPRRCARRVDGEHTDPGLAALQELRVGRGSVWDEGTQPSGASESPSTATRTSASRARDARRRPTRVILTGEVPARYGAISGNEKWPTRRIPQVAPAHFHTETISGLEKEERSGRGVAPPPIIPTPAAPRNRSVPGPYSGRCAAGPRAGHPAGHRPDATRRTGEDAAVSAMKMAPNSSDVHATE